MILYIYTYIVYIYITENISISLFVELFTRHWRPSSSPAIQPLSLGMKEKAMAAKVKWE